MPVKRTRAKKSRRLSANRIVALLEGPRSNLLGGGDDYFQCSLSEIDDQPKHVKDAAYAEMRADWEAHRDELMAWWNMGADAPDVEPWWHTRARGPDDLPWAAIKFDTPAHLRKDLK